MLLALFTQLSFAKSFDYSGSAFAISDDGYMVTAAHCVTGSTEMWITIDGTKYLALVAAVDEDRDVAIIKIAHNFKSSYFLQKNIKAHSTVYMAGYPAPEVFGFDLKLRKAAIVFYLDGGCEFITHGGDVCHGDSGGVVVNIADEAIGIMDAIFKKGLCDQTCLAVSSIEVEKLVDKSFIVLSHNRQNTLYHFYEKVGAFVRSILCISADEEGISEAAQERVFLLEGKMEG